MKIAMKTRDYARKLVNRVNACVGSKVLQQPAAKTDLGWVPTFRKGGTLRLKTKTAPAAIKKTFATCKLEGRADRIVSVITKPSRKL